MVDYYFFFLFFFEWVAKRRGCVCTVYASPLLLSVKVSSSKLKQ